VVAIPPAFTQNYFYGIAENSELLIA